MPPGCPLSPLLLGALMMFWICHIRRSRAVQCTVFLDDRTLWTVDEEGPAQLSEALGCSDELDRRFGLALSQRKCQAAATDPVRRIQLAKSLPTYCAVADTLAILGLR